LANLRGKL